MKTALSTLLAIAAIVASGSSPAVETPAPKSAAKPAAAKVEALEPEAAIRKTLAERLPNLPKIDEVTRSPVAGLYEVRYGGTEILYSDEKGEHILTGSLVETKTKTDLTEARIEKLTAIDFDKLPIKDAVLIKQGTGARKMAVFVDPNCGYCKRFERDLAAVKDITVYTFLIPILGPDSSVKSRDIWCAKEAAVTWRSWMLDGVAPGKADAKCDTAAIDRNLAFAQKYKINGTPALFFADGTRKPGAIPKELVEKLLVAAASPKKP
jgi:thiol:disulfide interchange protein DsbC